MTAARHAAVGASPWTARQRLGLLFLLALGVVGLVAGYEGTSGTLRVGHQVPWINLAGAALLVSGAGVVAFLTAGRRAIGRRRLGLFGNLAEAGSAVAAAGSGLAAGDLVAAPAMTRYHRADCSFVAGKTGLAASSSAAHQQAGRKPCGVCLPGGES
jgi:hypothetical protein